MDEIEIQYAIAALEDALDAANAKLARVEHLLNTGIIGIDDAQRIRQVLADD